MIHLKSWIIYVLQNQRDLLQGEKSIIDTLIEFMKVVKKIIDLFRLYT